MTSIGNSKVSKRSVAVILTICYWIATLAFSGFEAMHDPNSLGFYVIGFGVLFAAPVTLILLLLVSIDRFVLRSRLPAFGLIAVGVAVPIIYIFVVYTIPHERQANETQRMVAQSDVAIIGSVTDEVLTDSKGPIGVRLSYQITYPKGLELDPAKAPQAYVRAQDGNGKSVSFLARTRVVIPAVTNRFPPGTYTITNDFHPPTGSEQRRLTRRDTSGRPCPITASVGCIGRSVQTSTARIHSFLPFPFRQHLPPPRA